MEQRKCLKESLISRYKPELLGDLKEVKRPDSIPDEEMKQFQEIARDLYLYYGVSEEDIRNKTERYHSLLTTLSA